MSSQHEYLGRQEATWLSLRSLLGRFYTGHDLHSEQDLIQGLSEQQADFSASVSLSWIADT